jgi:hypothetical protein
MNIRTPRTKTAAGIAGLMLLAFPLAACGDDSDSEGSQDRVEAIATIENLTGDMTEIIVDEQFFPTLDSLGVTPGILGDAGLDGDTLSFPITGGNVQILPKGSVPNYVVGQIQHENSGLTLTAGQGNGEIVVELRNFNVDPTVSRIYGDVVVNGEVAATSAYLFRLNGSTLMDLQTEGDTAILEGTQIFISDVAAGLLNDTFGTDAVTDQVKVGVARITVNTGS